MEVLLFRNTEILSCLEIFKCIVMYNFVPSDALVMFVSCLCRVVNLKEVKITTVLKKQWFVGQQCSGSITFGVDPDPRIHASN
jgi:hypothetical protein